MEKELISILKSFVCFCLFVLTKSLFNLVRKKKSRQAEQAREPRVKKWQKKNDHLNGELKKKKKRKNHKRLLCRPIQIVLIT